jgi:TldD protein
MNSSSDYEIPFDAADLDFLRDLARQEKIEYFNVRFGHGYATTLSILKSVSRSSNAGIGHGFSVQAFTKGGYGFAIGQNFAKEELTTTFLQAARLARWSAGLVKEAFKVTPPEMRSARYMMPQKKRASAVGPDEKIRLLLELEKGAKDVDPRIVSTNLMYNDTEGEKLLYNSDGICVRGQSAYVYLGVQAVAKEGTNQQGYMLTNGGAGGLEILEQSMDLGIDAGKQAIELLQSKPAPAGKHDIIMDPLLTGTFIHEAFGHAAEADGVLAGESILAGKIGHQVGNPMITIVDDGTQEGSYGWTPYDDEGIPGQRTVIVEKGIMKSYLHSLETATRMGMSPTGNARAAGFGVPPIIRMRNTYLEPGEMSLEELLKEMKNGILGIAWQYGYVEPVDGSFQFKMRKAYQVVNGEIGQIYRDAAISGLTMDVLNRVEHLSKDLELDVGTCGKNGQGAPVNSGGPYTLIKDMIVGGE